MNLFPKNPKFFEQFDKLATTIAEAADILTSMKPGKKDVVQAAKKIRTLELTADTLCHTLATEVERTFITPIDREDIHALSQSMDCVIDQIEEVASKVVLYNGLTRNGATTKAFTQTICKACNKIATLVSLLKYRDRYMSEMKQAIQDIHMLENDGDELIRAAMKTLFAKQKNPLVIIKWKDLYETMEKVLDSSEDVADVVAVIIVKNF